MAKLALFSTLVLAACASSTPITARSSEHKNAQLARFMRETVSVPYSFALIASHQPGRTTRVHRAAIALQDAVADLVHWSNPPVRSESARAVFYAYAENLELHVARLEAAARSEDTALAAHSLENIRQTCNHCHRFFRPASKISADVALDRYAFDRYAFDMGGPR